MYRGGGKNQPGIKQIQDNKNRKKRERLGEKKGATDTEGNRLSCKSSCWGKIWPISYLPWEHLHACGTLLYSLLRQCFYSTQHATQSLNSPAASFICCMPNAKTYTHSYSCNTWSFSPRETMHFILFNHRVTSCLIFWSFTPCGMGENPLIYTVERKKTLCHLQKIIYEFVDVVCICVWVVVVCVREHL